MIRGHVLDDTNADIADVATDAVVAADVAFFEPDVVGSKVADAADAAADAAACTATDTDIHDVCGCNWH